MLEQMLQKNKKDNTTKHIFKEGSRYHVLYYDSSGRHCSEINCEINKK